MQASMIDAAVRRMRRGSRKISVTAARVERMRNGISGSIDGENWIPVDTHHGVEIKWENVCNYYPHFPTKQNKTSTSEKKPQLPSFILKQQIFETKSLYL